MRKPNLLSRDFFDDTLLKLKVIERNPQVPFPLHSHDFTELVIILSGSGIHFTEGAEYRVMPGDVFVIESGFSHGFKNLDNLRLYNIIFAPQILKQVFIDIQQMPGYHAVFTVEPKFRDIHEFESRLQLSRDQLQYCEQLISRLNTELVYTDSANGNRALALAYFIELVVYLSRIYTQVHVDGSRGVMRMAELFAFLQTHLDRSITIDEISARSNMSPSTLHRAFHRTVQCSPIEYHLQLRIDHALNLLKHSRLSISQVSEASGFSDSNYFSRQFRKRVGMSPREYKKSTISE
ncbi:MAG: helix-turn-helix domain-containing protein [Bacteroidetes bacterium]|nr:helix-turn-helix domain-containing protein [Bacteroidota bacterium]